MHSHVFREQKMQVSSQFSIFGGKNAKELRKSNGEVHQGEDSLMSDRPKVLH